MNNNISIVRGRPTFIINNLQIRAGGVILYYKEHDKSISFLFIQCQDEVEPFGGKTDIIDKTLKDTVKREADEESNGIIKLTDENLIDWIYFPNSKYILFFVESKVKYDPILFGTKEFHENIVRSVEWMQYDKIIHQKIRKIDKSILLSKIKFIIDSN